MPSFIRAVGTAEKAGERTFSGNFQTHSQKKGFAIDWEGGTCIGATSVSIACRLQMDGVGPRMVADVDVLHLRNSAFDC
jgi:hypothetical protein